MTYSVYYYRPKDYYFVGKKGYSGYTDGFIDLTRSLGERLQRYGDYKVGLGTSFRNLNCDYVCEFNEKDIDDTFNKGEDKNMTQENKLYEFKVNGSTLYGNHLATNSEGLWVMDVKGQPPVAVNKSDCKEVVPHSIKLNTSVSGSPWHVMAEVGKYKVGEIYITESGLAVYIEEVNTQTRTEGTFKPVMRLEGTVL